jgi:hypothetical protein
LGDISHPLAGVEVQLRGSWNDGQPGTYLGRTTTNAQGFFTISYLGSYPNYSLIEIDPEGYTSAGAIAGTGGIVPDSSGNWVEFRNTTPGEYAGTMFFDILTNEATSTPTVKPEETPEATPSPTNTLPSPTPYIPNVPIYEGLRAVKDTYLNAREPAMNYGNIGHLHFGVSALGAVKTTVMWFDLSKIPQGAIVSEAQLDLFGQDVYRGGEVPLYVYGLKRDWRELEATWLEAKDDTPGGQAGALSTSTDRDDSGVQGVFVDGGRAQYYEWNVQTLVQEWLNGRPNYGMLLMIPQGPYALETMGLYSGEYSEFGAAPLPLHCVRHARTDSDSDGNRHGHADRNVDADGNRHGHYHADADRTGASLFAGDLQATLDRSAAIAARAKHLPRDQRIVAFRGEDVISD